MYLKHLEAMQETARNNMLPVQRGLSRRSFLGASLAGASLALLKPSLSLAQRSLQEGIYPLMNTVNPTPYQLDLGELGKIHLHLPTDTLMPDSGVPVIDTGGGDPSTIMDFQGTVGVFEPFGGTGVRTNPDGSTEEMWWAADIRFLDGEYIDVDGNQQEGTFGFF